jgi:hypothetical protein
MTIRHTLAAVSLCALGAIQLSAQAPAGGAQAVTFNKDVAPIFYKNCTNCHRPGEVAPMSLLTFQDARPWVRSIGTRVANGSMPPWHADPAYGHFLNNRRLSARSGDHRQVGRRGCTRGLAVRSAAAAEVRERLDHRPA